MFDIGFAELLVLVIIAMVVIGPEKLPGVMRTVGKTVGQARRFMTGLQNQIEQEVRLDELNKKIMAETKDLDINLNKPASSILNPEQSADAAPAETKVSSDVPEPPSPAKTAPQTDSQVSEKDDSQRS